jgi:hypothetical protein
MPEAIQQKLYPDSECPERVTIRVLPEKKQVYPRFKELVTKDLGSDVCFVTTSLWEAFNIAMGKAVPQEGQELEIKFLRQNVQINIGCQITYQPKKARRTPATPGISQMPIIEIRKNHLLPLLLEEWKTLNAASKKFWRQRLLEEGIIPKTRRRKRLPSISTGARKKKSPEPGKLMEDSMTNVTGWRARLRGFGRRLFGR